MWTFQIMMHCVCLQMQSAEFSSEADKGRQGVTPLCSKFIFQQCLFLLCLSLSPHWFQRNWETYRGIWGYFHTVSQLDHLVNKNQETNASGEAAVSWERNENDVTRECLLLELQLPPLWSPVSVAADQLCPCLCCDGVCDFRPIGPPHALILLSLCLCSCSGKHVACSSCLCGMLHARLTAIGGDAKLTPFSAKKKQTVQLCVSSSCVLTSCTTLTHLSHRLTNALKTCISPRRHSSQ